MPVAMGTTMTSPLWKASWTLMMSTRTLKTRIGIGLQIVRLGTSEVVWYFTRLPRYRGQCECTHSV